MSAAVGVSQGWKLPFLYVSIPTCILSILVLRTTEDPPRAAQEITTQRRVSLDVQHPDFSPIVEHDRRVVMMITLYQWLIIIVKNQSMN